MRFGSVTQDTSLLTPTRAGKTFCLLTTAKSYVYVFRLAYDKNGRGKKKMRSIIIILPAHSAGRFGAFVITLVIFFSLSLSLFPFLWCSR